MNSFDLSTPYEALKKKQDRLETLAENAEQSAQHGTAADMREDVEAFTQAMGEYNLGDKVLLSAAKTNFSIEQQVMQELKQ